MQTKTGGVTCKPDSLVWEDSDNRKHTRAKLRISCFLQVFGLFLGPLHKGKPQNVLLQLVALRPWAQFVPSAPPDSLDMGGAQAAQALLSQLMVSGRSHCSDEVIK